MLGVGVVLAVAVFESVGVALLLGHAGSFATTPGVGRVLMSPDPSSQKNRHRCATVRPPAGMGALVIALDGGLMVHTLPIW